ncbi:MAG: CDP-alcohol phosphatidyltransferase family protein [Chloroflexi bacterium]|nr:CDP-alcohol phosphatidyltransferase family protein [Chloroflexota bacterium]
MANWITVSRLPVLVAIILLLGSASPAARLVAAALVIVLIAMDSIDGLVARKRGETSLMGSVLDIMVDRAVELVMWVWYEHLGLIPVAIPIIYILRGTIVDSLRGLQVRDGHAPFDSQRSRLATWLVKSPWMRTPYALAKAFAFTVLAVAWALYGYAERGTLTLGAARTVHTVGQVLAWLCTVICLVRGLPVIVEHAPALFKVTRTPPEARP